MLQQHMVVNVEMVSRRWILPSAGPDDRRLRAISSRRRFYVDQHDWHTVHSRALLLSLTNSFRLLTY